VRQAPPDNPADTTGLVTDADLATLALSSDPGAPLDPDAVPMDVYLGQVAGPLPEWYMPTARARVSRRWTRLVVVGIIGILLVIEAVGLCTTYGPSPFPFR
jgi:hypothetical protein